MHKFPVLFVRYVLARPAGKRCFVVSSNGTTVSRLRNGSILHHFPSALPAGARTRDVSGSVQSYCILDCIFHEVEIHFFFYSLLVAFCSFLEEKINIKLFVVCSWIRHTM